MINHRCVTVCFTFGDFSPKNHLVTLLPANCWLVAVVAQSVAVVAQSIAVVAQSVAVVAGSVAVVAGSVDDIKVSEEDV